MEYKISIETRRKMSQARNLFFANGGQVWNKMTDEESQRKCIKCNKIFRITNRARIKTAKFCSIECGKGHNIFYKGFTPWNKGKPHLRGSKHWNWKGGVDKIHTRIKQTDEYKEWRKKIYERDRWICQICGSKKNIVAHHIKWFSKYPNLRFEVSNGIVLCRACHQKEHKPRRKLLWVSKES